MTGELGHVKKTYYCRSFADIADLMKCANRLQLTYTLRSPVGDESNFYLEVWMADGDKVQVGFVRSDR